MAKQNETTEERPVMRTKSDVNIDAADLQYLYDFERDDKSARDFVRNAQQLEVPYDGDKWNSKYNLPEPKEVQEFASNIYDNYKETNSSKIKLKGGWKFLYRVQGSMFFSLMRDGFYAELYFNTENHYLLLAIKGTTITSPGDVLADIKNVILNMKGGALNSAITFGEKVRELILKFKRKPMLIITGHSLGGYFAQIITFTITYFFKGEDGSVQARENPSDEFGIYTMVFDSPVALSQMCNIDPSDILAMKRFDLPITNFVKDTNKINSNAWIGKHSGQVLAISGFENLDQPGFFEKIITRLNPIRSHAISNFDNVNFQQSKKVVHLKNKETVNNDINKINSMFFSPKEFELLHKFSILAPMCAELLNKLPTFNLSHSCLTLANQNISAEEFIPRAHWFLSQYKDQIDSGKFDGKQIIDMVALNFWRNGMLKDAHDLSLKDEWKQKNYQWQDGTKIGGFESHEEMRFVGCLLHNTIPRCFHFNYEEYASLDSKVKDNFLATTKIVLVLIVKDEKQIEKQLNEKSKKVKIIYLIPDSADNSKKNLLKFCALDEKSQEKLKNKEVPFMGNKVCALLVFGNNLVENLQVLSIYSFHVESALEDDLFYCDQSIASADGESKFKSATEFALELSKGKLKFVLISSDAGMGKSTALKQIAKTLQNQLQNYWIVHLNLFSIQKELHEEQGNLNTKAEAIEFVRNAVLTERKDDEVLKKVFDSKLKAKEMVLLFDSWDEICPSHRETATKLLELLGETDIQIVLTTRPNEGQNLKDAEIFSVEPLSYYEERKKFTLQTFQMKGKQPPSDIRTWLRKISDNDDFWNNPLILTMAVTIFDPKEDFQAMSDRMHTTRNIFETFFFKSISDTLERKFKLKSCDATGIYQEKFNLFNKLINILAICTIFHSGKVRKMFRKKISKHRDFINKFDLAKIDLNNYVDFLHRSFAEYLIAKLFVRNQRENHTLLECHKLKIILLGKECSDTRKHICSILALNPIKMTLKSCCFNNGEEQLAILNILIEEDGYELYLAFQDLLRSQLNKNIRTRTNFGPVIETYPLYLALWNARKEFVQQLVSDGAQFEDILSYEHLLRLAIEKGLYEEVKIHFENHKSKINEYNYNYYDADKTPLQIAARNGSIDMVEFLIEKGADVDAVDKDGYSALYYAIQANSAELVEFLIAKKANSAQALNWAALLNRKEIFDKIYEKYTPSEVKVERLRESHFYAVRSGHLEIVKYLISLLDVNTEEMDEEGETFLHIAAKNGRLNCMDFIFEHQQQSIDVRNTAGETPLMKACCNADNVETVTWLLDKKADINAVDNTGKSCLHHAARISEPDIAEILLNAGAKINLKDKKGWPPLFIAVSNIQKLVIRTDIVEYLIANSADVNVRDNEGNSCLHILSLYGFFLNVELLAKHLPVNCENHKRETPLHLAAFEGRSKMVEILLEEGAKQNLAASDGETILRLAKEFEEIKYNSDQESMNKKSNIKSEIFRWRYRVRTKKLPKNKKQKLQAFLPE